MNPLRSPLALAAALFAVSPVATRAAEASAPTPPTTATIPEALLELRHFRELGSVLYAAAHPDDENTQLLAWLSRGQGYRTADLSLTRGDGGQNVIGPELGDKLGVARTQELLAGRRLDGARQYFSRASISVSPKTTPTPSASGAAMKSSATSCASSAASSPTSSSPVFPAARRHPRTPHRLRRPLHRSL